MQLSEYKLCSGHNLKSQSLKLDQFLSAKLITGISSVYKMAKHAS